MSILIVGGDYLGNIPGNLDKLGFTDIHHITGRGGQKIHNGIPRAIDFILVLYDCVNHNLAYKMKRFACTRGIPIIYARRSWPSIYRNIKAVNII
jgi:hypothetical protein